MYPEPGTSPALPHHLQHLPQAHLLAKLRVGLLLSHMLWLNPWGWAPPLLYLAERVLFKIAEMKNNSVVEINWASYLNS